MNVAIDNFVAALAAAPQGAQYARLMADAFDRLDHEGDKNPDAVILYQLMTRAVANTDRSISERLATLSEMVDLKGKVQVPRSLLNS
jgi:hypothetical protein